MLLGRMSLQLVSCVADGRLLWLTKLCSFRWQDLSLICRFGMPALSHKVMAIALTLWLLNSFERAAAWLTCFIVLSNLLLRASGIRTTPCHLDCSSSAIVPGGRGRGKGTTILDMTAMLVVTLRCWNCGFANF